MSIDTVLGAIWFILPAYLANSSAVVFYKIFGNNNYSIDFGGKFFDKKRIFGDGKTWNGVITGTLVGTIVGYLQGNYLLGFALGFGAMFGDLAKSFFKRRLNIERGKSWFPFDQIDFVLGAFLFASFVVKINFTYLFILLIITPAIHLATNFIGFRLKIKKEPW